MNRSVASNLLSATALAVGEADFHADATRLRRRWVRPAEPSWARMAIFHGYGDHSGRYLHFMRWLADRGVACETFDFRGHALSGGRRGYVRRWDEFLHDAEAFLALPELRAESTNGPLFLLGHSHGGLVAATAVVRGHIPPGRVAGVILSSPYFRGLTRVSRRRMLAARACNLFCPSVQFANGFSGQAATSDPAMIAEGRDDPLLNRIATPRWYFSTRRRQSQMLSQAGAFRLPLLCLIAGADTIAGSEAAEQFAASVGSTDKQVIRYPTARHEILRDVERGKAFEDIYQWVRARADAEPI